MKINNELSLYEKEFYTECNKIKFFNSSLNEIKFQLEFLEKICKKELEIYEKQSSQILNFLNNFQTNILINYESEPSNLTKVISDLLSILVIYFQYTRIGLNECHKTFKSNCPNIAKNLEKFKENILKKSILLLKEAKKKSENKEELNNYLTETFESVVTNIFKGLVYIHQFFFLYSKAKNEFNTKIKNEIEKIEDNTIINIEINDFSERKYAKGEGIYYEPIHFENENNNLLLKNESENISSLCNSYLYYGQTFSKCMDIRKSIISNFKKLISDIISHIPYNLTEKISHIKDKILRTKNNFVIVGIGTEKSWDLLVQSWECFYNNMNIFIQFCNEICTTEIMENANEIKEVYKYFENEWEKLGKKIIDLRNKYIKYYTNERKKLIKDNQKEYKIYLEKEKQIKTFLNKDCYDFLNGNIPILRENEKKKATDVQDLCNKFKKILKKSNEESIESSKIELENSSSVDIFQEVKDIFNKQNNKFQIKDLDNYMDNLKDKILNNIDFSNDELAKNVKFSLDNFLQNDNELNSSFEQSITDNNINSVKEKQINIESTKENNEQNIINNIDLNSTQTLLIKQNNNNLLQTELPSKEIMFNEPSKNYNINSKYKDNIDIEENEKSKLQLSKNNTNLGNINESSSFISVKEYEENEENNSKLDLYDKIDIIKHYYNDPLIKNRLVIRSQKISEMLLEIHFFERLNKISKERMKLFEKDKKCDSNFKKMEEFGKIFINKENTFTSPLTLIFHYIFNPKTVITEYSYFKSFFETVLLLRGDYNINILYDKIEIEKIPKYFSDLEYANNLFNNYSKNDLDLFLWQIDTWYKSFSFQIDYVRQMTKITDDPEKINIRDVVTINFVSPTDLIVDYNSYQIDHPNTENLISTAQFRYHTNIKYDKNIGRFIFNENTIFDKCSLISDKYFKDKLQNIDNIDNEAYLKIHKWKPFHLILENGNKNNEIEAYKVFARHLKNTIFDYNEKSKNDFDDNSYISYESDYDSSNTSCADNENMNNNYKKEKNKNLINNDKLYYGILIILGLFSIKTLFGINKGIFSFDNVINILILISIGVILYKSKE